MPRDAAFILNISPLVPSLEEPEFTIILRRPYDPDVYKRQVREVLYQKGKHLNALDPKSGENEQNMVTVQGDDFDVTFCQIAGILARRIVFRFREGDFVERGQRVGLIKFGSRVNVLLPAHAHLRVALGQRVKGGASILADIQPAEDETSLDVLAESFA